MTAGHYAMMWGGGLVWLAVLTVLYLAARSGGGGPGRS